eukprot:CAMPEP_0194530732 /NCGR_PEP_ID=MMETSP0253-20130528/67793_1 /TAXON_ID=2966 /ORGANISM="Noctiluca scintillans" /LENGTH=539 /DNA_ID=CAMNT_0039376003 /DNA_START=76 /DNA_END=1692 /DNA_ORIENTATION=-
MNNAEFSRLLTTNDTELIAELTRPRKRLKPDNPAREERKARYAKYGKKGKGKGDGKGDGKGKTVAEGNGNPQVAAPPATRDRAKERREAQGEYAHIAAEWENHADVSVDQSKYLGGDFDHTHLVKGLDHALLSKVRTELNKQQRVDEVQQLRTERKAKGKKQKTFETELARKVWHTVVETLHPHHSTFEQRMQNMGKAMSMGQRIRGAPSVFLPGRMSYEIDTVGKEDIPRIIYMSKEDAPSVDWSKKVAHVLPGTVARVRGSLQKAAEERKQRKQNKANEVQTPYTVAQKVTVSKHKATDHENDIFENAGGFNPAEVVENSKREVKSEPSQSQSRSYFEDAGSNKYNRSRDAQLDPRDLVVEEGTETSASASNAPAFEPAERFQGPRAGWAFKMGAQGLGYYRDVASSSGATTQTSTERRQRPRASRAQPVPVEDDAYGECFPDSGMVHALIHTGEEGSDEEGDSKKKKKGEDGQDKANGPKQKGVPGEPKKKNKMTAAQQWQKIDGMIKKNSHSSMADLEAHASRRGEPTPRDVRIH